MTDDAALYGQIVCADDPAWLAERLTLVGVAATCRESAHYEGGRYVRAEFPGASLTFERTAAEEYLVGGEADGPTPLEAAAEVLSEALERLALRHRLELYQGERLTAAFNRGWPATQTVVSTAHAADPGADSLIPLPEALTRYFHDSAVTLESYVADGAVLTLGIDKEIGPERGILTFRGVAFLSLHRGFPADAIRAYPLAAAPAALWQRHALARDCFAGGETVCEISSLEGPVHVVIAQSLDYRILESDP